MVALLAERRWQDIRITAKAHGLRFNTRLSKAAGQAWLYSQLTDGGGLSRALRGLNEADWDALRALQAAGGALPRWQFEQTHGEIRVWRPWRTWLPRHIWRYPATSAEKLWYLGLVEFAPYNEGDRYPLVALPHEVAALLPPLPLPERAVWATGTADDPYTRAALVRDVAVLLGLLLHAAVRPAHGHWLPLAFIRRFNGLLPHPEPLNGVRSERQTGRTRFLHYLAEAAGLLTCENGALVPSPGAWRWLSLPPDEAWEALWQAVERDISGRVRLWDTYALPEVDAGVWRALVGQISGLQPGTDYSRRSLYTALKPHIPVRHERLRLVPALLAGPLTWMGVISTSRGTFCVHPVVWPAPQPAHISLTGSHFTVDLPAFPPAGPLADLLSFAAADEAGLRVDAESVRRAVALGCNVDGVANLLTTLAGRPLAPCEVSVLREWASAAGQLTLQWVPVLSAPNPATLAHIRADWRLRPLLGAQLSPHHMAVEAHHTDDLRRKLARRGYPVTAVRAREALPAHDGPSAAGYAYLAARVYQQVAGHVEGAVRLPGAVVAGLGASLSEAQRDTLDAAAGQVVESLQQPQRKQTVTAVDEADPDVEAAIRGAHQAGAVVTVVYRSPAYGTSVRAIEPQMIYESGDATYIEAWCQRDKAERTFRLDRVLAVVEGDEVTAA